MGIVSEDSPEEMESRAYSGIWVEYLESYRHRSQGRPSICCGSRSVAFGRIRRRDIER